MSASVTPQAAVAAVIAAGGFAATGYEKVWRDSAIAVVPVVDVYVIRADEFGLAGQRLWLGSVEIVDGLVEAAAVRAILADQPEAAALVLG